MIDGLLLQRINFNLAHLEPPVTSVTNLLYHGGHVYVAAPNLLLKLNALTLTVEQHVVYGPNMDAASCRYHPVEECPTDAIKRPADNYNKLLLVHAQQDALVSCWTWRQGVCDLRSLADLTRLLETSTTPVVASDPFNSTVGFVARAANSQPLLYVGVTHNALGPYRDEVPALAGRSLQSAPRFMHVLAANSQGLKASKASIEFMARFTKTFVVKYVHAFNVGVYNYFLSVQHMDADAAAVSSSSGKLVTKVARLCLNDLSFTKSYMEMPLRCESSAKGSPSSLRSIHYNELVAAKLVLVRSGGSRLEEAAAATGSYVVMGLFQETERGTFNESLPQDKETSDDGPKGESKKIKKFIIFF